MPKPAHYRQPPRASGRKRGKPLPASTRPEAIYDDEEVEVLRRQLEVRFAEFAADLKAKGMLERVLALREP